MSKTTWRSRPLAGALLTIMALLVPHAGVAMGNHGPRSLDLNPENSMAALRSRVRFRATLEDASHNPLPADSAVTIYFEIDGPGDPGTTGTADGKSFDSPDLHCTIAPGEDGCRRSYANRS